MQTGAVLTIRLSAAAVKRVRLERGIGLRELATRARISSGYLSDIEKGIRWGSPAVQQRLAAALGVPVSEITFDSSTHEVCEHCHGVGVVPKRPGTPSGAAA
jgi:transcriptional regulator with XRE-family HTH domain